MPAIYQYHGASNRCVQKPPLGDGSNSFIKSSLVYISSGVLAAVATDGVLVYGMSPDGSHTSGQKFPEGAPFGELHYPFDLNDVVLQIQVTDGSATFGSGGPTWTGASLAVGNKYALIRPTSGSQSGMQFLDSSDTTNTLFEVVGLHPQSATDDKNPLVLVKVLPTKIQAL